ncbi:MAG TPA: glucose-6-phosphate dehydrogenase, partial [Trebonia sp.]
MPYAGVKGPAPANPGVIATAGSPANPLRDPRDRRIPRVAGPCVMVMFGVTGDLARKKLLPALYDLANRGLL